MKKIAILSLFVMMGIVMLKAQTSPYPTYYPCKADNGMWGYVDENDRWTIMPKYTAVLYETNGGMYPVSIKGKWGFLGVRGEKLTDLIYDAALCEIDYPKNHCSTNFAALRKKGKWAFINVQGVLVTDFKYDEVMIYNGQYIIKIREGKTMKVGHLDKNGSEVWD